MKKILLALALMSLTFTSCEEPQKSVAQQEEIRPPMQHRDTVYIKIIKDLKEVQEAHTDYHTKLNVVQSIWDGDVKTSVVPDVSTKTTYFIVFNDGTHMETSRDNWLNYSKGDTIPITETIYY